MPTVSPDLIHPLAEEFRLDGHSGTAYVLVHGFTGNPAHFRHLAGELSDMGHTVIAPRLVGHGISLEALGGIHRREWLGSVLEAGRQVGDHREIHLVGLSMGGLLSILAARTIRAATVTTINSPIAFRNRTIHAAVLAHRFVPEQRWPEEPPPPMDDEVAPYWIHLPGFPTSAAAQLALTSYEARWEARRLDLPALVIQSKADETVDPRSGTLLARALGARLLWLERSIHNALFDDERHVVRDAILGLTA